MAVMTDAVRGSFDLRTTPGRFRSVALAEAVSWVGLLIGMYFKYLGSPRTEVGVKVFGMAHGLIFITFVITALLAGIAYGWSAATWLLALLASIVPLGTVIFLIWIDRAGRLGETGADGASARPGGPGVRVPDPT
jgi:integral membrane protein